MNFVRHLLFIPFLFFILLFPLASDAQEELTPTPTAIITPSIEITPSETVTPSPTLVPDFTLTESPTPTFTPSLTPSTTVSPTPTNEITPTPETTLNPEAPPPAPNLLPAPELPKPIPGRIEGEGTFFEIKDSEYLNVSLNSSEKVKVLFESSPAVITLNIDSLGATSTQLTINNAVPKKKYHLYIDDFHNHTEITANENGSISFYQDITQHRLIFIQEQPSTKYIDASGTGRDCSSIGVWNNTTKTCTMNKDVNETIQIDAGGITLDGNGYKLTGTSNISNGIYFKTGVNGSKVKNLTISGFSYTGINFYQATNNFVDNVTVTGIGNYGIWIGYSSNGNTISNSKFIGNGYLGTQLYQSGNNTFNNNVFSGNGGKGVYLYQGSHGNTFTNNQIIENKGDGVDLSGANNNIFTKNNISSNLEAGIYYGGSNNNNNEFRDNIISKNYQYGVESNYYNPISTGNLFDHNLIFDHAYYGIYGPPGTNTYRNNVLINNSNSGIQVMGSNGNEISGNLVTGSSYGIYISSSNNLVFNNTAINNNYYGIYIQPGSDNRITNNRVVNSIRGIGIYAQSPGSHNNIITKNLVTNNSMYGFLMLGDTGQANNNQIYNNDFLTNVNQAYAGVAGSIFNQAVPVGGNFWNNWTAPDNNNDGFVDNAYNLLGGKGAKDNYPWTKQHGWLNFYTTDNNPIGWQKNDFTIALNCKDKNNNSCDQTNYGLDRIWQYGSSTVNINTEGFHLIEYYSRHGGVNEDMQITHALLDKTPPQITGAPKLPPAWNNWYNTDVLVVFKATDSLSGIHTFNNQVTVTTEGNNQSATTTATDKAGNSGSYTVTGINIDKSAPVTTATFAGDHGSGSWYKSDVVITLSAVDAGSGVNRIEYSFNGSSWITYTAPFTINTEGLNTFYYRAIDNLDNIEAVSKTSTILYNDGFQNNYNPTNWPNATFLPWFVGRPATLSNGGIGTGGKTYYGLRMSTSATGAQSSKRWGIATNQTFSAGPDLFLEYAFMPMNAQANSGLTEMYLYDEINNKYIKFAANYYGYSNRPAEVEISGLETRTSGHLHNQYEWLLFRIESRLGQTKFSVIDGADTVRWSTTYNTQINQILDTFKIAFSQSAISTTYNYYADNMIDDLKLVKTDRVFRTSDIHIDKTLPSISASFTGTQGANDWYIDDVTATLTATDNNAIDKIEYSYDNTNWVTYSSPVVLTSSGETTFYWRATDLAGNTASGSQVIKIDKTAPVSTLSLTGTLGSGGWYTTDVIATLTAVDNEGGMGEIHYSFDNLTWQTYTQPFTVTNQETTVYYYAKDLAGNIEVVKSTTVKIDKIAPISSLSASGTPGNNHWYRSDVQVTLSAVDNEGGMSEGKTEYSFDTITWYTYSIPFTITLEGAIPVYYRSIDSAGNVEIIKLQTLKIDKTAPILTGSRAPLANIHGWNNEDVTVHFDCTDGLSGVQTVSSDQTVTTEGTGQSRNGSCTDNAGNESSGFVGDINIDKTAPTATGAPTTAPNANGWYNMDITVHFEGTDTLSGVDTVSPDRLVNWEGTGIFVDGAVTDKAGNTETVRVHGMNIDKTVPVISGAPTTGSNTNGWYKTDVTIHFDGGDDLSGIESVPPDATLSSEGKDQSVEGTSTDKAGNTATTVVSGINIDKTAPIITATKTPDANGFGWNNSDVTVHFDCTDSLSGKDTVTADETITTEGKDQSKQGTCTDKAGNLETIIIDQISIDKTNPTITFAKSPDANTHGWNNSAVTIAYNCQDELSGVDSCAPNTTIATEGANQTTTGIVVDKAGNTSSIIATDINIDLTVPGISGSRLPLANIHGWNNEDVTVHFDCTDGLSGVQTVSSDQTVTTEGMGQSRNGSCTDNAGNESSGFVGDINIDKTKPTATGAPTTAPNANGWYNNDVIVHFEGTDVLSGVDTVSPDRLVNWEGAGIFVDGAVTDKAGNTETVRVHGMNIDKTVPVIAITVPVSEASYLLNQSVLSQWKATDALSGMSASWATVPSGNAIDTATVGNKTFTVTAEDLAGNSNRTDIIYGVQYKYGGILQPINANNTSIIKLGRTIPVKFQLTDYAGSYISTATARLYLAKVSSGITGTEIEGDSTSSSSEGNLFRYDNLANQYIFNLNTKGLSTGTWQLRIELDDQISWFAQISVK